MIEPLGLTTNVAATELSIETLYIDAILFVSNFIEVQKPISVFLVF